jgi:hypothetical protein
MSTVRNHQTEGFTNKDVALMLEFTAEPIESMASVLKRHYAFDEGGMVCACGDVFININSDEIKAFNRDPATFIARHQAIKLFSAFGGDQA